jgi:hypothetical protein
MLNTFSWRYQSNVDWQRKAVALRHFTHFVLKSYVLMSAASAMMLKCFPDVRIA